MKLIPRILAVAEFVPFTTCRLTRTLPNHYLRLEFLTLIACAFCHTSLQAEEGEHLHSASLLHEHMAGEIAAKRTEGSKPVQLPPLPAGVAELKFGDFFVRPAGPRGLELTERLRQLDGRRVRILGYMVQQEEPPPGRLLLAPVPAQIHEHDNGLADDLPPSLVFVSVPTLPDSPVPHAPGLMLLTGTLSVGGQAEKDGRISLVRLALDPPERTTPARKRLSVPSGKGAERLMSSVSHGQDARP